MADVLIRNVPGEDLEALARVPQVGVLDDRVVILGGAHGYEIQTGSIHQVAEIRAGDDCDLVAASLKALPKP